MMALFTQIDRQILYAVDKGGRVRVAPVGAGGAYGTSTAINQGLETGTLVAVAHLQRLHKGMKVEATRRGTQVRT